MTIIEATDSLPHRLIPITEFATCLIDGKTRTEICKMYPGKNVYYLQRFDRYLKEHHGMDIKAYVIQYGGVVWPKCPESGRDVGFGTACGKGLLVRAYAHHAGVTMKTSAAVRENAEKMKVERRGTGNPMHGKPAWNLGLNAESNESMARVAAATRNRPPPSKETREKMRQATLGCARHNMPHSPETVEKMRVITARRWAEGGFNKGATSIHVKMREFLQSLPLLQPFQEEVQEVYYSLDFAFPSAKIAIECDGDYFHINPQFYPDGPKDAIQRRNAGRDKAKNTFLYNRNWIVLRFWECDINAGSFKERLLCELRRLGLLSP